MGSVRTVVVNSLTCEGVGLDFIASNTHSHRLCVIFGVILVAFRIEIKSNNMSGQDLEFLFEVLIANRAGFVLHACVLNKQEV